ncbi:sulfite exporter TauE/SafE family protein 3-like [Prunus avium]|uniref:Sulfite exporter TauE/SafE family protein 3-like n=1 Tax=Prunus avium TaxID=42229 RepID=A0A6P5TQ61_PRUAV|nr:sulfite exporter TauE/SafE family protein 3-like [Prunus avium]XP_021829105.1 sulfite exporter TauE/SafE family protein 3-like [Prunus avium]XP_021829107.1 sulfite exporter TauE/SafE family protein 3-like [Prunus avium]
MATRSGSNWWSLRLLGMVYLVLALVFVSAQEILEQQASSQTLGEEVESNYLIRVSRFLSHRGGVVYKHVWPEMSFGWKIVVGTIIGFLGAAFGSVGGVGGGGFFVPMLTLIIGFDQKSSTALSKCMITGGAAATVFYNLRLRHPTLELPLIDYDLALLFQPMLVLGISIGVSLNVVLSEWMITILLIIVLLGTSTKSFFRGIETWKKETITKKNLLDASKSLQSKGDGSEDITIPGGVGNDTTETKETKRKKVSILHNVRWRQLGVIVIVWIIILALQIAKNYATKCSVVYWILNLLQIPVTVGITSYEAVKLYKGSRIIESKGEGGANWRVHKLVSYCAFGIVAGIIGGLLGLGGGFIMAPLFLEMGIPPQVSSATATFIMTFSSSMSVVEYYLLKRFPIPYALYFAAVATVSAIVGQHLVGKVIKALGRASLIIFILAFTIFVSALTLGGVGIANMVKKIERKESLWFERMCTHKS